MTLVHFLTCMKSFVTKVVFLDCLGPIIFALKVKIRLWRDLTV